MNKLPLKTRVQILAMLCEGSSMGSISRIAGVSINTVSKLLVDAGTFSAALHDREVRKVASRRVQCLDIWSFAAVDERVGTVERPADGSCDLWTWTAIETTSKLIVSWLIGGRDSGFAHTFLNDVRDRLDGASKLTTDGNKVYLDAAKHVRDNDIHDAMLNELYGRPISAGENAGQWPKSSTHMRVFPKMADTHKKLESYVHMVALYSVWHNFIRFNQSLNMSPAMAAGITRKLWSMEDLPDLVDDYVRSPQRGVHATSAPSSQDI